MSDEITLYPYQKDAVKKIISEKNTLLAFDVGAGKTYIMIAAAMKMREEGISRKNMFVVPNNIVGQWELIFKKMYPGAKLMTVEPKVFKPEMRKKVLSQIRGGDYDGIIIAYSCFEMIPLSSEQVISTMNKQLSEIKSAVDQCYYTVGSTAALEREIKYIKKLTGDFLLSMQMTDTAYITFEKLEINSLFVDEAHNFKNIPLRTALKSIAGINVTGSKKCLEMLHKVRSVQDANGGRGVVFATGTPLCNSIADTYTMQMYLQYDELKKAHLDRFDNWIKTFAKPEKVCEIDVDTSKFRFINRFSKFFNLPELSRMFSDIAVFYAMNKKDGIPKHDGYDDVLIPRSTELIKYMDTLRERAEKIRAKAVDKKIDNMLKVSTDGRKAALDLRLVGKEQHYDRYSKIYQCVHKVMELCREDRSFTQIIFCDYSTPKGERFHVYAELKKHFLMMGVPEKEIAFIHSYHSEAKKVALYEKINAGTVRILIGSTFKLGIGANVQQKLKAVHHLDVPWRPSDMVQREGRIMRRGNENESIKIFRYICKGSFDAYSWQILETTQRFISQFLNGSAYQRTATDLEENVLTYAQVKALAIADERMKELAEKQNELRRLKILSSGFALSQKERKEQNEHLKKSLILLEQTLENTVRSSEYIHALKEAEIAKEYGRTKTFITHAFLFGNRKINFPFLDFQVYSPEMQNKEKPFVLISWLETEYSIPMGNSPAGNARRIVNFLKKFDRLKEKYEQRLIQIKAEIETNEAALLEKNPYAGQIALLNGEVNRLKAKITEKEIS